MAAAIDTTRDARLFQVRDLEKLRKFGPSLRKDRDLCFVREEEALYYFDVASAATADGVKAVAPDSGTGRWFKTGGITEGQEELVESATVLNPVALTPTRGERWLIDGVGAGAWVGQDDAIAEWYGDPDDSANDDVTVAAQWRFIAPTTGMQVTTGDTGELFVYTGAAWDNQSGTLAAHLNGGASKHDASEIDYERADGSKKFIQAASDDVESAITDLDDAIAAIVPPGGTASGTLQTTDATPAAVPGAVIVLDDDTAYLIEATFVARQTSAGTDRAAFVRRACAYREAAGAATFEGAVEAASDLGGMAPADATLIVSGNNVQAQVTGIAANVEWFAKLKVEKIATA